MTKQNDRTSSAAVSRAKMSAKRARGQDSTANGLDSGVSLPASFASYDPTSCSWRMSQASLFEDSTKYLATWPGSGSMRDGHVYARPTLEHPISDAACSSWPTPCTTDAKDSARATTTTGVMNPGTSLTDAIRSHLPHPTLERGLRGAKAAVLSPAFVEALMGLPEGWTQIADDVASDILVTRSSRSAQKGPSGN